MPGMMDTILNLGLNDETVHGLVRQTGDARFVFDSYRRFIQMYANGVLGLDHGVSKICWKLSRTSMPRRSTRNCRLTTGRQLLSNINAQFPTSWMSLSRKTSNSSFGVR